VCVSSKECTIDISRAERGLGYRPVVTRDEGLAAMASEPGAS
jgi:nucleoside-diphosphate-sugar epimerase